MEMAARNNRNRRLAPAGRVGAHLALTLAGALALLPALTTTAAYQDVTSLVANRSGKARWQTFLVEAPAGAAHQARLKFADSRLQDRLPAGGVRSVSGRSFALGERRETRIAWQETRVLRAQKGGRVVADLVKRPPEDFSAGSVFRLESLLRPVPGGKDERVTTAFTPVPEASEPPMTLARAFRPAEKAEPSLAEDTLMVAALDTKASKSVAARVEGPLAQTTALGYAPAGPQRAGTPFDAVLKDEPFSFIPPVGEGDHSWASKPLPDSVFSEEEQTCLATGIYHEARGESILGQAAVAQVILNRVRNPAFPNTICGVVYQNENWRNRCQFSFACDGRRDRIRSDRAYATAKRIAEQVTKGEIWLNEVGSATHYHANYVHPRWANAMERVDRIGHHIFYRTFGGGWD